MKKLPVKFTFLHASDANTLYTAELIKKNDEMVVDVTWTWEAWDGQANTQYDASSAFSYLSRGDWIIQTVIQQSHFIFQILSDDNEWVEISEEEYNIVKRLTSTPVRKLQIVE